MATEVETNTAMESPFTDGMMAVKNAVEFTRLSRAELYAAMARGELKYHQYGRRRLIAKKDLVAWLESKLTAGSN